MNRMALGLAIGAGYVLGRTKKAKMAVAVGSLVAGKRMNLSPKAVGDLVSRQLRENPQFKEIGDQLRQDLSGVGKAASGAMVERQLDSLANRLHGRTSQVRDQLAGVTPEVPGTGRGDDEDTDGPRDEADEDRADARDEDDEDEARHESAGTGGREEAPARKKKAAKAPAKKASARTAAAKRTSAGGKPAGKKTAGTRRTSEGARGRQSKGSGER